MLTAGNPLCEGVLESLLQEGQVIAEHCVRDLTHLKKLREAFVGTGSVAAALEHHEGSLEALVDILNADAAIDLVLSCE